MTKELQNLAWSRLPKEFKEEVKKMLYNKDFTDEQKTMIRLLFGDDNLTSDAEGEEMLTVNRKEVQKLYAALQSEHKRKDVELYNRISAGDRATMLSDLFGSKCLPDDVSVDSLKVREFININELNVDKFVKSEPKFKVGDIVRFKYCCTPYRIDGFKMLDGAMLYQVGEVWAEESDLEPYTEPKEDHIGENTEMVKDFDTILKDGFREHNRLQIAAMMMQGLLANPNNNANLSETVSDALNCADALIAESGEGGS